MPSLGYVTNATVPSLLYSADIYRSQTRTRALRLDASLSGVIAAGTAVYVTPTGTLKITDPSVVGSQQFNGITLSPGIAGQTVDFITAGQIAGFNIPANSIGLPVYADVAGALNMAPNPTFHLPIGVVDCGNQPVPEPNIRIGPDLGESSSSRSLQLLGPYTLDAGVDTAGGLFSLANPFGASFVVTRTFLNVSTAASSGTFAVEAGVGATGTTASATLLPSTVAPPVGITQSTESAILGSTQFLTVSTSASLSSGLVATIVFEGFLA